MPVQTRARDGNSAAKKVTYTAASPPPKQQHFPPRRRHIKTYGRPRSARRTMQQETLTQMNFVSQEPQFIDLDAEDEDDGDQIIAGPQHDGPMKKSKSKSKKDDRRKTMGDEFDPGQKPRGGKRRKTMGDSPTMSMSSSFHTQTLTQFLSHKDEDEEPLLIQDSEAETDDGFVLETPSKPRESRPSTEFGVEPSDKEPSVQDTGSQRSKLATPKRTRKTEIPSSESPAITPMLMRYSPLGKRKSPLQGRSTNVDAPSPILRSVHKRPRGMVVQDTYSTVDSSPTNDGTPTPKQTAKFGTPKKLRFEMPEDKENITPGRTEPKTPKRLRKTPARPPLREVPDSDAEDEDSVATLDIDAEESESTDAPPESPTPMRRVAEAESYYGHIGDDTQAEILSSDHLEVRDDGPASSTPKASPSVVVAESVVETVAETPSRHPRSRNPRPDSPADPVVQESPTPSPQAPTSDVTQGPAETQYTQGLESQRLPLDVIRALGPQTPHSDIMVSLHPEHLAKIVDGTKNHEFRVWKIPAEVSRVWLYATKPVSELRYMCVFGPPKAPGELGDDERGVGNRAFNQGRTVNKYAYEILQVYELNDPVSLPEMLRKGWIKSAPQKYSYVLPAVVGALTANLRCALFGDIDGDDGEVEGGGVDDEVEAGGGPCRLPPSRNAKDITESQELRDQIQSDVAYSTQHQPSDLGHAHGEEEEQGGEEDIIPSSQTIDPPSKGPSPRRGADAFVRPALPKAPTATHGQGHETEDQIPTQTQAQTQRRSQRNKSGEVQNSSHVRPSQATTVTQMSSSPAASPESSVLRRRSGGGLSRAKSGSRSRSQQQQQQSLHAIDSSSPIAAAGPRSRGGGDTGGGSGSNQHDHHHSLRSSQFLTRSQMLPDSLINDETREPPPIIWDSADERSD